MKLVSINVGLPREIEWRGETVKTAIWKNPVTGPVAVHRTHIEGDSQADLQGHGGEQRSAMVYQLDSYRYWSNELKRNDFSYGQFGENFTVEGLADSEVCIGDRFRIGTALFEITQPRVTCFKVGIRMNLPEMPALLVAHRRPGFYFRVIEEGTVSPGNEIVKVASGPEGMTITQVDLLLYGSTRTTEQLQKALRITALSPGWRNSFEELLKAFLQGKTKGNPGLSGVSSVPAAWTGFRPLRVAASRYESPDVKSFELEPQDGSSLPSWLPGQHLAVKVAFDDSKPAATRMYSLCGSAKRNVYRIAVKREVNGAVSSFLHDHVATGSILDVSAPRGTFVPVNRHSPIVLMSAGIGVTPVLAMLHAAIEAAGRGTPAIWWVVSVKNRSHQCFADEVSQLADGVASLRTIRVYSQPAPGEAAGRDFEYAGRLDLERLRALGLPNDADFYLCGPHSYLDQITGALKQLPIPASNVHFETFGSALPPDGKGRAPHAPTPDTGDGPLVSFARSGISFRWNSEFGTLLDAAEKCDVPVRWSCRSGVCHSCESALIDGEISYRPTPLDPPPDGSVLICCATPKTAIQLDL